MNTVYLHIGTPKTGTSALQHFFYRNAEKMYEDGIWYPNLEAPLKKEKKLGLFNGNAIFFRDYDRPSEEIDEKRKNYVKEIFKEAAQKEKDLLLSSEALFWCDIPLYQNLKLWGVNVKVIIYLRRQDYWGESMWNQNVKKASYQTSKPCFEYVMENEDIFDYQRKLQQISGVLGKENVIVRTYSGEIDIFSDFFHILGIDDLSGYVRDEYQANPSLSANYVEIKRILNGIPGSDAFNDSIKEIWEQGREYTASGEKIKTAPLFLSREERQIILDKYKVGNEKIAKEYLDREKLFSEKVPEGKTGIDTETIYADMIKFFGSLFVQQFNKMNELRKQVRKIELPDNCEGKKVVVYGIDRLGKELYECLKSDTRLAEVIAVDRRWKIIGDKYGYTVMSPQMVDYGEVDYIMIGVEDEKTYLAIREYLISEKQVEEKKIIRMNLG